MTLYCLFDDPLDGPENMARDEYLLHAEWSRPACLRLYEWSPPTISLGYFQSVARLAELPAPLQALPVVRRTTGGGAILHDQEITYCLILDDSVELARRSPVELYRLVHAVWRDVLAESGVETVLAPEDWALPTPRSGPFFCFESPGRTDLLLGGKKVLGSAQRRLEGRVLQHGSLLLEQRFTGHPGVGALPATDRAEREHRVAAWKQAFAQQLACALGLSAEFTDWPDSIAQDLAERRARYASSEWTQRR